jgi:hypothetical protein
MATIQLRASRKELRSYNNFRKRIFTKNQIDVYDKIRELSYTAYGMLHGMRSPKDITEKLKKSAVELAGRIEESTKNKKR